jgi:hypothetical protein
MGESSLVIPLTVEVTPRCPPSVLRSAIELLADDNFSLSCAIRRVDGGRLLSKCDISTCEIVDAPSSEPSGRWPEPLRPDPNPRSPLWRVEIITGHESLFARFRFHHLVVDGWSLAVIVDELESWIDEAMGLGRHRSAEGESIDFDEHTVVQRLAWERDESADRLGSLCDSLAGARAPMLDAFISRDRSMFPAPADSGRTLQRILGQAEVEQIEAFARRERAPVSAVMYAVLVAELGLLTGGLDILVATAFANRSETNRWRTIGCLASISLIRCEISPQDTFSSLLDRCKRVLANALDCADIPLVEILRRLPDIVDGRCPSILFQVGTGMTPERTHSGRVTPIHGGYLDAVTAAPADLHFILDRSEGRDWAVSLWYSERRFEGSFPQLLFESYLNNLAGFVEAPEKPLRSMRMPNS